MNSCSCNMFSSASHSSNIFPSVDFLQMKKSFLSEWLISQTKTKLQTVIPWLYDDLYFLCKILRNQTNHGRHFNCSCYVIFLDHDSVWLGCPGLWKSYFQSSWVNPILIIMFLMFDSLLWALLYIHSLTVVSYRDIALIVQ